mgnify:CR=1 FL=1
MLNINSNYGADFAAKAAKSTNSQLNTAFERLSSGSRINFAKDDAAGQGIATRLSAEVKGLAMAARNAADAQSLVDTVDGALNETHTILLRMRELSLQTSNDTLTNSDRQHVDAEFQQLKSEIDRIANNTTWAGMSLLNGTEGSGDGYKSFSFQVGSGSNQKIDKEELYHNGTMLGLKDEFGDNFLSYQISDFGRNISGGQAQRCSLLKIISNIKPILILDEPCSALDTHISKIFNELLLSKTKNSILIVITHSKYQSDLFSSKFNL